MRIIGGRFRRRQLLGPKGVGTRPTSDRLRETLFNVIGPTIVEARVLDAFAGTGALALEAISRGATEAVLVEADPRELAVITENIRRCGAEAACRLVRGPFPDAVATAAPFDVILLDPPYDLASLDDVILASAALVKPTGLVVLEHSRRREAPVSAGGLTRVRLLAAGDSALSFYRSAASEPRTAHD